MPWRLHTESRTLVIVRTGRLFSGLSFPRRATSRARASRAGDAEPAPAAEPAGQDSDEITAELTAAYWRAYTARMASVGFRDVARRFPGLVGQAVRLAWSASHRDTVATIALNLASGVFAGYALFATTGVLGSLFAGGPPPHRVRAALPSLILV